MKLPELTSRERMLRAISYQDVDYTPCSFMSFTILRQRLDEDRYAVARAEQAMGLDPFIFIPTASRQARADHPDLRGLPLNISPQVQVKEWRQAGAPGEADSLNKVYATPAGQLTTSILLTDDWPYGSHIPFIDDYQVPRMIKPLITEPADLEKLAYFLLPPSPEQIARYRLEAEQAKAFSDEYGMLVAGGWGVGMDMANWLCGMESLMFLTVDQPDMIQNLLEMIHTWNKQRMEVVLAAPVDLFIRRAWYEGCDFITPRFYHRVLLPQILAEAELAHAYGAKFGYICSSGTKPMLDDYLEAGIDVLIGVDPIQGTHTNLPLMKQKLNQRICLWGGVSGAITVEQGSEVEVRSAVREAQQILGATGFILSPVDNLTVDEPRTWENIQYLIDEWKRVR